jgi:hypothetical protein
MTYYEKDEIRSGIFLTKDGGRAQIKMSTPRPVRYGDPLPDLSAASANLEAIRQRLEKLRADVRAARVRK